MARRGGSGRPGLSSILALGVVLLFLGPPFAGAAMLGMSFMLHLPVAVASVVLVLLALYMTSGVEGAVLAVAAGVAIGLWTQSRGFSKEACAVAGASAVAAVSLASIWGEGIMALSPMDIDFLVPLYASAGIPATEATRLLGLMVYLSPALGAMQTTLGAVGATLMVERVLARRAARPAATLGDLRLGMPVAYVTIALLAVNLLVMHATVPGLVQRVVHNCLLFMAFPYALAGLSVLRAVLEHHESMLIVLVLAAVLFPPLAIAGLVLAGILDTWLDLHGRARRTPDDERNRS